MESLATALGFAQPIVLVSFLHSHKHESRESQQLACIKRQRPLLDKFVYHQLHRPAGTMMLSTKGAPLAVWRAVCCSCGACSALCPSRLLPALNGCHCLRSQGGSSGGLTTVPTHPSHVEYSCRPRSANACLSRFVTIDRRCDRDLDQGSAVSRSLTVLGGDLYPLSCPVYHESTRSTTITLSTTMDHGQSGRLSTQLRSQPFVGVAAPCQPP